MFQSLLIQQTRWTPHGTYLQGLVYLLARFLFALLGFLVDRCCLNSEKEYDSLIGFLRRNYTSLPLVTVTSDSVPNGRIIKGILNSKAADMCLLLSFSRIVECLLLSVRRIVECLVLSVRRIVECLLLIFGIQSVCRWVSDRVGMSRLKIFLLNNIIYI